MSSASRTISRAQLRAGPRSDRDAAARARRALRAARPLARLLAHGARGGSRHGGRGRASWRRSRSAWRRRRPASAVHPKLARCSSGGARWSAEDGPIDWGLAEALAFGSLLVEGTRCASRARTARAAPSATATPCSSTRRRARSTCRSSISSRRAGALRGLRQPALRGGRARLRVRLQPRRTPRRSRSGRRSSATSRTARR